MINFSFSEFRCNDGTPLPDIYKANVLALVNYVLDPLRDRLGYPIIVTSGFRTGIFNARIGGSPFSQHLWAKAADIVTMSKNVPFRQIILAWLILDMGLPFDQLILGGVNVSLTSCHYVHVSYDIDKQKQRREILYQRDGSKEYAYITRSKVMEYLNFINY